MCGATEIVIETEEDSPSIHELISIWKERKSLAAHSIITITVESQSTMLKEQTTSIGKLAIISLSNCDPSEDTQVESLSSVLKAIKNDERHIDFEVSDLTNYLQDCLS